MASQTQTHGTHWRKVHRRMNENLLFAEDLGGKTSIDLEIIDSGVIAVSDGDASKDMPWVAFRGAKKRLALNATNCKTMQTLAGTGIIEEWRGPITLLVVKTTFKDRKTKEKIETDAIRISPKRPRATAGKAPPSGEVTPKSEADQVKAAHADIDEAVDKVFNPDRNHDDPSDEQPEGDR